MSFLDEADPGEVEYLRLREAVERIARERRDRRERTSEEPEASDV